MKNIFRLVVAASLAAAAFSCADSNNAKEEARTISEHFNAISPENCLKPEAVQTRPGVWTFDDADEFVKFGEEHDLWMLGHTLVWHNQTPAFYWENPDSTPKTREELIETIRAHIETVAGRYEELFRIFYNRRDKIDRVTLWGLTDDSSWKNGYPVPGRTNYPLLWNRDYTPHRALQSVLEVPVK